MFSLFYDILFEQLNLSLLTATKEASDVTPGYIYRKICRNFSKTFNMSLAEVESLPVGYVLKHTFEERYDEFFPEEILEQAEQFLKTSDEAQKDSDDLDELIKKMEEEEKARKAKNKAKTEPKPKKVRKIKKPEQNQELPPEVDMTFDDPEDI